MGREKTFIWFRGRRSCLILILVLIVLISSCGSPGSQPSTPTSTPEKKLSLTEEIGSPFDFILCIDQSDSMNGWDSVPATDPKGIRIDASKYFINNLSERSEVEPYLRIGLVEFGTNAELLSGLQKVTNALDDPGRKFLSGKLEQKSLGYTNFLESLRISLDAFEKAGTFLQNRKPIIVIFTDGEPDDPRNLSTEAYFQEIIDFYNQNLKEKGCEIFVLGIDAHGSAWGRTKPYWESFVPSDHIFYLSQIEELNQAFNQVIWKVFYLPTVEPDIVSEKSLEFQVQPYLEKIQFDVYPEGQGELEISIFQPDGKDVLQNPEVERKDYEKYFTVIVKDPIPGTWRYEITQGKGKVVVYKTLLPIVMQLVSPKNPHPLGRPIEIVATFQKKDGTEVRELPQYPLRFTGTLITPKGESIPILFRKSSSGLFFWEEAYSPQEPGIYQIILSTKGREGFEAKSEYPIEVKEIPYLIAQAPQNHSVINRFQNFLDISVSLAQKGEKISPEGIFTDNPNSLIMAEIVQRPDKSLSGERAIYLDYDPSSRFFKSRLPTNLNAQGVYTLKVELEGRLSDGTPLKDQLTLLFEVSVPFWKQKWFYFLVGGLGFLILLIWYIWWSRKPELRGTLYWKDEGFTLKGKKFTIGGMKCDLDLGDPKIKKPLAVLFPKIDHIEDGRRENKIVVKFKNGEEVEIENEEKFNIPDVDGDFQWVE